MTEHRLPVAARLLVAGNAVTALGNGLMVPLTLIYAADSGEALLWRVKADLTLPVVELLPDGSPPEQRQRVLGAVMASLTGSKHLNPERRHRSYPRVVKRARHNSCRVKRAGDHGARHSGLAMISLVNSRRLPFAA